MQSRGETEETNAPSFPFPLLFSFLFFSFLFFSFLFFFSFFSDVLIDIYITIQQDLPRQALAKHNTHGNNTQKRNAWRWRFTFCVSFSRFECSVDISPFIDNLPYGKSTTNFSTPDASGSTSQARVYKQNASFFECFPHVCPEPVLAK